LSFSEDSADGGGGEIGCGIARLEFGFHLATTIPASTRGCKERRDGEKIPDFFRGEGRPRRPMKSGFAGGGVFVQEKKFRAR
jgi:hypothetical protein